MLLFHDSRLLARDQLEQRLKLPGGFAPRQLAVVDGDHGNDLAAEERRRHAKQAGGNRVRGARGTTIGEITMVSAS